MTISLSPELRKYVEEQVRSGRFESPEQVVAEALSRLMEEGEEEIDDETYAALRRGDGQLARGEGRAWEDVRDELRAKYTRP